MMLTRHFVKEAGRRVMGGGNRDFTYPRILLEGAQIGASMAVGLRNPPLSREIRPGSIFARWAPPPPLTTRIGIRFATVMWRERCPEKFL